jgi:hypothetical protein
MVAYVATISSIAAPTVAELNAGTLLTTTMTPDGLIGFEAATALVDNSNLASTVDTNRVGRDSFPNTAIKLKKQVTSDTIYDLMVKNLLGHIVIRRDVATGTAWTAAQKVEVYPIECGTAKRPTPAKNTLATYEVPTVVYADPNLRAVVAA